MSCSFILYNTFLGLGGGGGCFKNIMLMLALLECGFGSGFGIRGLTNNI